MSRFMQIEKIVFGKNNYALCALPNDIEELEQTVTQMGLVDRPAIVLVGGHILPEHATITFQAVEVLAISPEGTVTWPDGPRTSAPLLPNNEREELESHYSHFILVPGNQFGDESKWIVRAASMITKDRNKSVTVLVNGGKVSQRDVEESLSSSRPIIVLEGTGRLADEIASMPVKSKLIKVVPAYNRRLLAETLRAILT
jgi:hypothetical protein